MHKKFTYDFERPSVTADVVLFAKHKQRWHVLLIKRKSAPFKNKWALPGGFVESTEALKQAAARELYEETNLRLNKLKQLGTYGDPGRDPRGWTVTVAFGTIVEMSHHKPQAKDDACEVVWMPLSRLKQLAFDHLKIIRDAKKLLLP